MRRSSSYSMSLAAGALAKLGDRDACRVGEFRRGHRGAPGEQSHRGADQVGGHLGSFRSASRIRCAVGRSSRHASPSGAAIAGPHHVDAVDQHRRRRVGTDTLDDRHVDAQCGQAIDDAALAAAALGHPGAVSNSTRIAGQLRTEACAAAAVSMSLSIGQSRSSRGRSHVSTSRDSASRMPASSSMRCSSRRSWCGPSSWPHRTTRDRRPRGATVPRRRRG